MTPEPRFRIIDGELFLIQIDAPDLIVGLLDDGDLAGSLQHLHRNIAIIMVGMPSGRHLA